MPIARNLVKNAVIDDLSERFNRPITDFTEQDNLSKKWMFDAKSLTAWGDKLRQSTWYEGWFAPSEIRACKTIAEVIDLMFETQGRTKPVVAAAKWTARVQLQGVRYA